ncbi:helix-turn-helix domain-containing protein [Gluconacetobacter sacchari]|uniref:Helix-turn-helix transcriptional regulator n=1 Tax=Gluconacetobacter sacchari TaxID=92759 RepID=A0A7W4NSP9_9PROT|nr:helix-turn-helix transcriptional regulator [Gluconacetobacter sacchari]
MHGRIKGARLRDLRQARGWTREELAERCDLSPRSIQRFEGGSRIARQSAQRLARRSSKRKPTNVWA